MFRHMLVPLDGSVLAESVLPAAAALSSRLGARITLLHVVEPGAPTRVHGERHLSRAGEAEAYLEEMAAWLERQGAPADWRVEAGDGEGDVALRIFRDAEACGADLIALCTHGRRGFRGLLFGRVAQQVLSRGAIPVFLVPPSPEGRDVGFDCQRILLPLDGSEASEAALPAACGLARAFDAELLVDTVVATVGTLRGERGAATRLLPTAAAALLDTEADAAAGYLEGIVDRLREENIAVRGIVERGDPARALIGAVTDYAADMLVMATHGRSGVSVLWAGSVASRVLERSPRPILLIRIT